MGTRQGHTAIIFQQSDGRLIVMKGSPLKEKMRVHYTYY